MSIILIIIAQSDIFGEEGNNVADFFEVYATVTVELVLGVKRGHVHRKSASSWKYLVRWLKYFHNVGYNENKLAKARKTRKPSGMLRLKKV